ncbi:MAG: hypothetical protein QNJ15_04105 [Erythrobacter sp.]|nr:hypothetical protein [Erythrobacter sp.]
MKDDYTRNEMTWDGITIEIGWAPEYFSIGDGKTMGHLEIRSIDPEREPLPVTDTGYRSHWMTPEEMDQYGGPLNFVEAWIGHEAQTQSWIDGKLKRAQLELF